MVLFELIANFAINLINQTGYLGVIILMALESMIFPVPSEAVMPFVGFLIQSGKMDLYLGILASSIGSIIGSLLSYYIAYYGGRPIINKYGKYFLLNNKELEKTEKLFEKHGSITVLICRFIPVVRHIVSLPAGLAKMNIWKFILYTLIGATIWNTILIFAGITLEKNWGLIVQYSQLIDYFVAIVIFVAVVYFVLTKLSIKKKVK